MLQGAAPVVNPLGELRVGLGQEPAGSGANGPGKEEGTEGPSAGPPFGNARLMVPSHLASSPVTPPPPPKSSGRVLNSLSPAQRLAEALWVSEQAEARTVPPRTVPRMCRAHTMRALCLRYG